MALCLVSTRSLLHAASYNVSHVTPNTELSASDIYVTYIDSRSIVWIGSDNGLYRFDGSNYRKIYSEGQVITPHIVNDIIEDGQGNIWCATSNGLYYVTNHSSSLKHIILDKSLNRFQRQPDIITLQYYEQADLVVCGTVSGVYIYNTHTEEITEIDELREDYIMDAQIDNNGMLWLATWDKGLIGYNFSSGVIHSNYKLFFNESGSGYRSIHSLALMHNGTLVAGVDEDGIYFINVEQIHAPRQTRHILSDTKVDVSRTIFNCFAEDRENGILWAGANDGVFSIENINGGDDIVVECHPELLENVRSLNITPNNNMWVTSEGGNIQIVDLNKKIFTPIEKQEPFALVTGISVDGKGQVIVGAKDQFIYIYNAESGELQPIYNTAEYSKLASLKSIVVNDVYVDRFENLWIATKFNGLIRYNPRSGEITRLFNESGERRVSMRTTTSIIEDNFGNVWVTATSSIFRIKIVDEQNYTVAGIKNSIENRSTIRNKIKTVFIDDDGCALISFTNIGLFKSSNSALDSSQLDLEPIYFNDQIIDANTILLSRNGEIWIGTNGRGLLMINNQNQIIESEESQQIPNLIYYKIIEDAYQDLWAITNYGLLQHKRLGEDISWFRYDENDGLICSNFAVGSMFKSSNDKFIIGGGDGINIIQPANVECDNAEPRAMLLDDEQMRYVESGERMTLKHNENTIRFNFIATDMTKPENYIYLYKLEGADKQWTFSLANNRYANYHNLPAGEYRFLVKATNHHGVRSKEAMVLNIKIEQNPLKSTLAIVIYVIIALSIAAVIIHLWHSRRMSEVKFQLKNAQLDGINKINSFKIRFFTMVSHDLLSSLSILNTVADQWDRLSDSEVNLREVVRQNSSYIHNKITRMLNFKSIDQGEMSVSPVGTDITALLNSRYESYKIIADKNPECKFIYTIADSMSGVIDHARLFEILDNLVTNAIKFTSQGAIELTAEQLTIKGYHHLAIQVKDSGCGIDQKSIQRINEGLVNLDQPFIGLRIVMETVKAHKGKITFQSAIGEGTTVKLIIPIAHSFYSEQQAASAEIEAEEISKDEISKIDRPEITIEPQMDKCIVIINRDKLLVQLYSTLLSSYYTVKGFLAYDEAKEYIEESGVDVVIVDYNSQSNDFVKQIKQAPSSSSCSVIAITSTDDSIARAFAYSIGIDSVLNDPIDFNTLAIRIESLLAKNSGVMVRRDSQLSLLDESTQEFINDARNLILNHIEDAEFSVADLCNSFTMSNSSLYRKFKTAVNMAPNRYIQQVRIEYACQILSSEREVNIYEVAYRCGFKDLSYFSACFKKHTNQTPRKYQELFFNIDSPEEEE